VTTLVEKGTGWIKEENRYKANEKRKMGIVKKSKRWGGEWIRAEKRGKGCPGPMRGSPVGNFLHDKCFELPSVL